MEVPTALPDKILTCPASGEENRLLLQRLDLRDFRCLLDGGIPEEDDGIGGGQEVRRLIEACPPSGKFRRCVQLVENLVKEGKPVIIWCVFVDSIQTLSEALEARGVPTRRIYGAVPLEERQDILRDFKAGCFQVLLTNPHTLAESVSLHSVCHDAVYFEYSYNLVHLLQSKDRIHRLGLAVGQYTQYVFLQTEYLTENGPWSMEGVVYQRLRQKEETMLEAIGRRTLEVLPSSEEDLEMIFKPLLM